MADHGSQDSRQAVKTETGQGEDAKFRVNEDVDFMGRGWVCYPSRLCDYVARHDKSSQGLVLHP